MLGWLKRKKEDPNKALKRSLGSFELPTFPSVVLRALDQLRDPNSSPAQVGRTISLDPRASTRLLSIANSGAYALRHPVRDVEHAASLLGRGEVESLLLSVGVQTALPKARLPGYDPKGFWGLAGLRASAARSLASAVVPSKKGECFTGALLQDMAIPLLAHARTDQYCPLLEAWHGGEVRLWEEEIKELGFSHAVVAGWMCDAWSFPDRLRDTIGAHHDDEDDPKDRAAECVATVGLLGVAATTQDEFVETAHQRFALPKDQLKTMLDQASHCSSAAAA
jgi:HD-like signal output (HDOD) protein